jgi:ribosomal protein S18 acetylase RimI-like enzyme
LNSYLPDPPMLTIRPATETDIPLLRTLCLQVWPQTYATILTPAQIDYMLEMMYSPAVLQQQMRNGTHFLVCYDDAEPCGFAAYQQHTNGKWKLDKLYVLPNQQGKGTGRFIIDYIVNAIRPQGANVLQLQVNKNNVAKSFYQKLGFVVAQAAVFDIGNGFVMDDYVMELRMESAQSSSGIA